MTSQRDTFYTALMRLLFALLLLLGFAAPAAAESLARIDGKTFIAPDGRPLSIKGISLGNWLMPEGYMFKFEVAKSPRQIFGAFDRLLGPERAVFVLDRVPRHLHRARRHPLHQVRRLQYRAHPAALPPVHDRPGRNDGRGLGAARSRAGMGARGRPFRHRRLARRPRRPDRHQPRRRAGLSADVLCAARSCAHGQAVARHRPALQRRSGDPGLRHPERTDRALS